MSLEGTNLRPSEDPSYAGSEQSSSSPLSETSNASTKVPDEKAPPKGGGGTPRTSDSLGGRKVVTLTQNDFGEGASIGYPPVQRRVGTRDSARSARSARVSDGGFDLPPLKKRLTDLLDSGRKISREPTARESAMACVKASWLNVLLVFIPVGWALHFVKANDTVVFVTTFLAIIPLAKLMGFGTEEIALRVGQTLGGLLNATLGNAVELIVAIIALIKCEINVVQSSLLGSILSNLLLVLGMCFFAGGIKFSEQGFKDTAAQLNSSLLVVSVIAILIPAGYNAAFSSNTVAQSAAEADAILKMSRGTAIILLFVYGAYLIFQLFTHQHLYVQGPQTDEDTSRPVWGLGEHRALQQARSARRPKLATVEDGTVEEEDEEEIPTLSLWAALILLIGVTVLVGVTAEFLVSSINGVTAEHPEISVQWVGLILLPIVGNAAEHVTAVSVSVHDKIDLSMGVAVGSSIQIALFVIPFMVTLAWIMDKPLTLLFDPFESITLFLAVLVTNYTIQDGKSNWLEGFLLMMVYIIMCAFTFTFPRRERV